MTATLRAGFNPSQPRDPGGEGGGQWVKGSSSGAVVAAGGVARLPERTPAQLEEDRRTWRRGVQPSPDGFYHVYHGTTRERAGTILGSGLNQPGDTGLTLTTSPGQALRYGEGYAGEPVVVHLKLTPDEAQAYLFRPEQHDVYGFKANAHAIKRTIPAKILNRTGGAPMTEILQRSFEVAAVEVEGRTVDVRVVPFGEVARVADPPDWTPYEEEWLPGCFDHQLNAANRVHANYEHGKNITDVVGHGVSIRSEPDGYHITSVIHKTNAGDTALELLNAGALPGVSLEAVPVKNVRSDTGVMQRVKAHLRGFAFCREGAFSGAQVLAVRDQTLEEEQTLDAGMMPVDMDPELVQRLRALNVKLPDRYTTAHPDQPDTPAQTGTSDDGTRQPTAITSSKE